MRKKIDRKNKLVLLFDNRSGEPFPKGYELLTKQVALACLRLENFHDCAEVSLSIVNDDEMQGLNRMYRNQDRTTDVLSFPFGDENGMDSSPAGCVPLGDIVISIEKAREQASEFGHSIERELGFLTAHSMLHLLGYDHADDQDERVMIEKQERILSEAGLGI